MTDGVSAAFGYPLRQFHRPSQKRELATSKSKHSLTGQGPDDYLEQKYSVDQRIRIQSHTKTEKQETGTEPRMCAQKDETMRRLLLHRTEDCQLERIPYLDGSEQYRVEKFRLSFRLVLEAESALSSSHQAQTSTILRGIFHHRRASLLSV